MIPSGMLQHLGKLKLLVNENSTTILTGVGVAGTVVTAYLTGRATFKAADIIAREQSVLHDLAETPPEEVTDLSLRDKAKLTWPLYIPPVVAGIGTITCIVLAHRISAQRIAALTVATGISERALQEYKTKVQEKLTPQKEQAIRDEIAQDRVNANPPSSEVIISGDDKVLCYDAMTGRYFRSTIEDIKRAENSCNNELNHGVGVSLSRFFDELGLSPTNLSDSIGWFQTNPLEVQFSTTMTPDSRPCVVVDFTRMPSPGYSKVWD